MDPVKANQKSDEQQQQTLLAKIAHAITSALSPAVAKADGFTFDDALFRRKIGGILSEIGDLFGAFMETAERIAYSDGDDKAAQLQTATADMIAALSREIPTVLDDAGVAKAGKKLSSERLARLKAMQKELHRIIAEVEGTPVDKQADKQTDKVETTATVDAAVQKRIDDLEKKDVETQALVAKLQKALDETTGVAKAAQDALDLKTFSDELRAANIPHLDIAKDAPILKKQRDADPEGFKRTFEILKANAKSMATAGLFVEKGHQQGAEGDEADSAEAEIEKRAVKMVTESGGKLTKEAAVVKVLEADSALYARHVAERD